VRYLILSIIKWLEISLPFVPGRHGRRKIGVGHALPKPSDFLSDFVERILYSAQSLGSEAGVDRSRG
jgi:hypothetical protein